MIYVIHYSQDCDGVRSGQKLSFETEEAFEEYEGEAHHLSDGMEKIVRVRRQAWEEFEPFHIVPEY